MRARDASHGPASRRHVLRELLTLCTAAAVVGVGFGATRLAAAEPGAARQEAARGAPTVVTPSVHAHRVIAYYFHTTQRCASCRAIEAYSREAIEIAFAEELEAGRIVWTPVNIDVKGNEHFVKDYALYTKSLVLVDEKRGKPARWKHLEKVWQYLGDKPKFLRYVQDETRAYLAPGS
jgi:hypothetical protein